MGTSRAGVGQSSEKDAKKAGQQAAQEALKKLDRPKADACMVFATAGYDQAALLEGISGVVGGAIIVGCTGEGVITADGSDESSHKVAVLLMQSSQMKFQPLFVEDLSKDQKAAGRTLAAHVSKVVPAAGESQVLFLFADGLLANCTQIFQGLEEGLGKRAAGTLLVGGLAGELMTFTKTFQYLGKKATSNAISALLVTGKFKTRLGVSHGCSPIGTLQKVTRAVDNVVYEIDGRPAWDLFRDYLEGSPSELRSEDVVHLCVGVKLPKNDSKGYSSEFIIRTPLGLNKETQGLSFPCEIPTGTQVQMTRRDPEEISRKAVETATQVMEGIGTGQDPVCVFQFDCTGRGRILFGENANERLMNPVNEKGPKGTPWIGFHTYGEIAPLGGKNYFHNYTVVLLGLWDT